MNVNDNVLSGSERRVLALRQLYLDRGYRPYRMGKFEPYDLYARNKEFLLSEQVITFTDTDGKLMALKPDVTLSIIRNSRDLPNETQRVFYNENVYRVSKGTGAFQEIMQAGVECFGSVDEDELCRVLTLAGESLELLAPEAVLALSDLDVLQQVIRPLGLGGEEQAELYRAVGEKNLPRVRALCAPCADRAAAERLEGLLAVRGTAAEALPQLDAILSNMGGEAWRRFRGVLFRISAGASAKLAQVDFSVTGDMNYYNGVIFKGFVRSAPTPVLSGGQYDGLMRKMGRASQAVGFAVYTDALERLGTGEQPAPAEDGFVNVALPKGRLGEKVYDLFARAGYECPALLDPKRRLIFENPQAGVRYFWVKPSDVAIYVERGAADVGVAGKDILLEYEPDVYELLDLKAGKCRMAVAAPKSFTDDPARTLRVATKFAKIARKFYQEQGRDIDVIHLNGSIEIAPILGLSDVIVDIVETGATLRENDLAVVDEVTPISARLIANKSSFKFKSARIERIVGGLTAVLEGTEQ